MSDPSPMQFNAPRSLQRLVPALPDRESMSSKTSRTPARLVAGYSTSLANDF